MQTDLSLSPSSSLSQLHAWQSEISSYTQGSQYSEAKCSGGFYKSNLFIVLAQMIEFALTSFRMDLYAFRSGCMKCLESSNSPVKIPPFALESTPQHLVGSA